MKLVEINQNQLNLFVAGQKFSQFLQSWEWGKFQKKAGFKIFRLGVEDNGRIIAVAAIIKKKIGMGKSYFYCPRGPVVKKTDNRKQAVDIIFSGIEKIAKKEKAVFLRFEPDVKLKIKNYKLKIVKTIDIQPAKTIFLDLTKTEDELLKAMHQKTRYNIRLAERKGVKVRIVDARNLAPDFDKFWKIMEETVKRDKFRLHSKEHYRSMLQINNDFVKLVIAEYEGKIIAGNILTFFGDTAAYAHGASGNEFRNLMAPYALQWQAIKSAREKGFKYYDFYGIDEDKWPGVTRFKKGFGGEEINLPGTYDLIFNKKWYILYNFIRRIKRLAVDISI